jgi:hypothetical protein
MPIQLIIRNPLDRDAREFIGRAGATDAAGRLQINEFVRGVKSLGLWNSMVCWPLRSTQNAGTGTTAHSLGGLGIFNGTLINGPTWGANGLTNSATGYVQAPVPFVSTHSLLAVYNQSSTTGTQTPIMLGDATNALSGDRRSNFRTDNVTFLFNGTTFVSYAFGPASLNAFRVAGIGVVSQGSLLGYNNSATTTLSTNAANISGGSPVSNVSMMATAFVSSSQHFVGTVAFGAVVHEQLSSGSYSNFYELYKATLGTGLGLP